MLPPFNTRPAPPRMLGTSGIFGIPDLSPSIDEKLLGPVEPRDKTKNLGVAALKALREQGVAAAKQGSTIMA
jgi:hypothetical protein